MNVRVTQAEVLLAIASSTEVFRALDGETVYATVEINGHRETWPVRSKGFRRWLVGQFYASEGRPPGAQALQDALGVIEARAQFAGAVHPVCVRVAGCERAIYFDLANDRWEAVEITAEGWRVKSDPPVKFRRARGMLSLPHPVRGGSLEDLRQFINVRSESDWRLFASLIVQALSPDGPYPVGLILGEHGAAKSTAVSIVRALIDPNTADLRSEPRDVRDIMIAASNAWILAFDNLSHLPSWLSDVFCRLATGGGFGTRELYSDAEEIIFNAKRPIWLNGIEEIATRSDLLDRCVIVHLPPIPDEARREEREFWASFNTIRPAILGTLLDAASTALRNQHTVSLERLPRMADYARWVAAASPALGWDSDSFINAYQANRDGVNEFALDASPVAAVIRALADEDEWTGTATQLLKILSERADEAMREDKSWPRTGKVLSGVLRRLAPNLRAVGVAVDFQDRPDLGRERRQIVIQKIRGQHRSDRSNRSGGFSKAEPFGENAEIPRQNARNVENAKPPSFSNSGELEEVPL